MNAHKSTEEKIQEKNSSTKKYKHYLKIHQDNFNVKLDKEKVCSSHIGERSKHHESNENGRKLIESAFEKDLSL